MKEFIDKTLIMLLSVFVLNEMLDDSFKVPAIFILITVAALMSYLRMLNRFGKITNICIEYAVGLITLFVPEGLIFIPIVSYEAFLDRQIPAGIIFAAGLGNAFLGQKTLVVLLLLAVTGVSVFLSHRTEVMERLLQENRKVRDEGEIKKEQLNDRNRKLLEEQDKSINTAQLAERNRIAREIHDNVGHMLSRSILQVGAMMVVHKDGPIHDELKELRATLDTAMNNIRASVHDLRDEAINLETAVKEMAEPLKTKHTVTVEIDADSENMNKEIKYACINIVKEAVSNIIKYSSNEYVDIRFDEHPSMYTLIVHDYNSLASLETANASGASTASGKSEASKNRSKASRKTGETLALNYSGNGMGLENIRQRAEQLGGQANFSNENGFRVFVRIPKSK